ncbi:MAG: MGDG synthase family glycosyltransferase [Solirubrobacteraceae bacterium]
MGEGHNAAAAAITAVIDGLWPGCQVERIDTLELRGRRFARFLSWGYKIQMSLLPFTYEVIYDALCRSDRFAALFKAGVGRLFGPGLEQFLAMRDVDLVISTYPFGSAALHWLRTERGQVLPAVTYIPAFHVHPVWTYAGIDQHYVMYDSAPEHARTSGFERTMRVGAPPVRAGFGSVRKSEARAAMGFDDDEFIALVTGGAWGLGGILEAVQALLAADIRVRVVAVCGRGAQLRERLLDLHAPADRLSVLGYVDNMHELMAAADVVITNGAGVTVLEALCTPRPVIAFRPLAGHGKASTDEMIRRNLAVLASDVPELVSVVRRLATDRVLMARMEHAGRMWTQERDLRSSVRGIEELFAARQEVPAEHEAAEAVLEDAH